MQVFIPYIEPIKVAECLDRRRLHKQCLECQQILDIIDGKRMTWKNHPVVKMWTYHNDYLMFYMNCLKSYFNGDFNDAQFWNDIALTCTPNWLTNGLCNQHKKRLYTKNPELYLQFKQFGKSYDNWYIVDNELKIYCTNETRK